MKESIIEIELKKIAEMSEASKQALASTIKTHFTEKEMEEFLILLKKLNELYQEKI